MEARCKILPILLLLCLLVPTAKGEQVKRPYQAEIDSLEKIIKTDLSVEEKAFNIFELSFYYSYSDSATAHNYLKQGLLYKNEFPVANGMGKVYEGLFYMDYDLPKAIRLFEEADAELAKIEGNKAKWLRAKLLNNMASAYQWQDKHIRMLEILVNRALPMAKEANDDIITGNILYKIGLNFWNNLQYTEANKYLLESLEHLNKGKYDPYTMNEVYKLLVVSLNAMDDSVMSEKVMLNYEKFIKRHKGSLPLSDYHFVHSVYNRFKKNYDVSLIHMDKSIEYLKKEGEPNPRALTSLYYQRALINLSKKDFQSAFKDLNEYVEKRMDIGYTFFQDSLNIAIAYVKIYEGLKDYKKAMEWVKKKDVLQDTMYNRRIRESLMDYEVKYQTLEKEGEILSLKTEREKTESDIKNTRIIIALVAIILLLIGYFLFKNHQKNKRLLQQQEINNNQKLLEEKQKQKLLSLDAMLHGEEKERNRLSRDLHDGLGSILASIKYKILDTQLSNPNDKVNSILVDMDFAITEMRRISHNLMPESLRRFGLAVSLGDLCKSLQNSNTKIELQLYGLFNVLSQEQQTHIYRIIQELIYNSLKHSEAKHILVQCSVEDNVVFITVEDDGKGFKSDQIMDDSKDGVGLTNVKIRVNYLHGKLDIRSEVGKGTSIDIEILV
ncbi:MULTISPECIES: sensor histidine kinase [unclassified Sphingobacterium]|uniref:sensor histidine kinase n=1 Tax=unclassified Sphingobacterium TaxID=2609468 RepID=UPI0020C2EEC2|nr:MULTISPECIES: sensor histidine kinase [unclassified Sphingobacterium]MBV2228619.1 sensor histidine kinase [Sphingobacterium mizutaii]